MSEHHDDWFKHTPDEPEHMTAHGDTNSVLIILFLLGTIVFVFITAILIEKYFKVRVASLEHELQEVRADVSPRVQATRITKEGWENTLSEPRWIDQSKGIVALPLDIAMQRVVDQYN
ncbi:hypothetical protein JYT11_00605 [Planctomycetaceae bacterium AH-315-I19]|nr:hypothetical protein [Planctomycetaceae bacterium AH-315-I19]